MKLYLVTYGETQDAMYVCANNMAQIEAYFTSDCFGVVEEIKLVDDEVLILSKE